MAKRKQPSQAAIDRQARSRALEKEYKSKVARLKKAGVFTSKVDARKKTTRYQRSKVRKFGDVLEGIVKPIRVSPAVRKEYEETGRYRTRGPFALVPADEKVTYRKRGGRISETRGAMTTLALPFPITSMQMLVRRLRKDPTLNGLRRSNESFAFRIFDNGAHIDRMSDFNVDYHPDRSHTLGFKNVDELAEYIEIKYKHLFTRKETTVAAAHFELVSFRDDLSALDNGQIPPGPNPVKFGKMDATGRSTYRERRRTEYQYQKDAERKRNARERETESQRADRLAKDAARHKALRESRKKKG